jgi:GTPase SAR1 family protein
MGGWFSGFLCGKEVPQKEFKLLMVGLDGSGKSTILYKLKLGEYVHTIPTM